MDWRLLPEHQLSPEQERDLERESSGRSSRQSWPVDARFPLALTSDHNLLNSSREAPDSIIDLAL
jgi:hypothetical protein